MRSGNIVLSISSTPSGVAAGVRDAARELESAPVNGFRVEQTF
jgi:hypothetical protein